MKPNEKAPDQNNDQRAGEVKRDKDRQGEGGPRYGGEAWEVANERGDDRFGHARNDDADPSELVKADEDVAEANPSIESGGEQAGFGRGEKPRKARSREKK